MLPTSRHLRNWLPSQWVAALLVPYLVAGASGIPLVPWVAKDRSQPFPCQDCACACRNAEACWNGCGCLTDREKVVWAQAHGVAVPAEVRQRLSGRSTMADSIRPRSGCRHCGRSAPPAGLEKPDTSTSPSGADDAAPPSRTAVGRWVLASAVSQCQGLSPLWSHLSLAILPVPAETVGVESVVGWLRIERALAYPSWRSEPASPPPRSRV